MALAQGAFYAATEQDTAKLASDLGKAEKNNLRKGKGVNHKGNWGAGKTRSNVTLFKPLVNSVKVKSLTYSPL